MAVYTSRDNLNCTVFSGFLFVCFHEASLFTPRQNIREFRSALTNISFPLYSLCSTVAPPSSNTQHVEGSWIYKAIHGKEKCAEMETIKTKEEYILPQHINSDQRAGGMCVLWLVSPLSQQPRPVKPLPCWRLSLCQQVKPARWGVEEWERKKGGRSLKSWRKGKDFFLKKDKTSLSSGPLNIYCFQKKKRGKKEGLHLASLMCFVVQPELPALWSQQEQSWSRWSAGSVIEGGGEAKCHNTLHSRLFAGPFVSLYLFQDRCFQR